VGRDNFQKRIGPLINFQKRFSFWPPWVKTRLANENPDSGLKKFCNFSVDYFFKFYNVLIGSLDNRH